ncbi:MAG: hypothetical protein ACR2JE_14170 [Acidobacteriaceae bacterium]
MDRTRAELLKLRSWQVWIDDLSTLTPREVANLLEGYEWNAERREWVPMRISDDEADYIIPRVIADLWKA